MKSILKFSSLLLIMGAVVFVSCKEDEPTPVAGDPIATFTYEINASDFKTVDFSSAGAQNAASYAWDFGDNAGTSTEANPSYTYAETGAYTVSLIVKNADGKESNTFTQSITITDPDEALKLLTGDVSKTWVLIRDGSVSMSLGPDASNPAGWWEGSSNNGQRACLYYQEATFGLDGSYTFDDKGGFWAEFGVFFSVDGCDQNKPEACFEATAGNMVNACGEDVSAWLSGSHTFTYDASTGEVVLNGTGAWFGIPKLDEAAGYRIAPTASTTFTIEEIIPDDGVKGYDQMNASITIGGDYWDFTYAHYTGTAPDVVDDFVPPACEGEVAISPAEISHTFASNEAAEWVLMQPIESGSGLELSVANPDATDAVTTPLVGKLIRVVDVPYQELQFKLDPVNAVNFENLTTITMDVYLPSTNDYSGALTDNVFVGFGATKCNPPAGQFWWYENNIEYQATAIAKDTWTTLTFQLNAPDYVNANSPSVDPYGRNDLDMIYINFGGGNHPVGGDLFMKNFSIQ